MEPGNGNGFTQHIDSGGTGHQARYSGQGQRINTGGGIINNYNGAALRFGMEL